MKVIATIASLLLLVCPMARRAIFPEVTDAVTGVVAALRSTYICDVEAVDKPTSGVQPGDFCLCLDTGKYYKCLSTNVWSDVAGAAAIPSGLISLWHGLLSAIPSGWALCDGQNGTPDLRDRFVKGAAAGQNPGTTGGSPTHTHADHPALAHSGAAVADHASHTHQVTPNVSVDAHSGAAVSAHAGTAVADHPSHTHSYTDVPNHTHPHNMQGGTTGATTGTNVMGSTATGGSSRAMAIATGNPTGGVASGTTQGPSATLTHVVTQPSNHVVTQPSNHVVSNPAVTSAGPSATLSHAVTQPADHAAQAHQAANSEPSYYAVAYIMKT